MVTVTILHDVENVEHALSSPRWMEFLGPLGISARTFVVDREKSNRVGLIIDVPSMAAFQVAMGSAAAAEAMKSDGVRPETGVVLTEAVWAGIGRGPVSGAYHDKPVEALR